MRFLRFLGKELLLRALLFTLAGTLVLVSLYLVSVNAPAEEYGKAASSFFLFITGSEDFQRQQSAGFSSADIVIAGAKNTFPLAMVSLFFITVIALASAACSASANYLKNEHGQKIGTGTNKVIGLIAAFFSAVPLFVGYGMLYAKGGGSDASLILVAIVTVMVGGLGWDAARFLIMDMKSQLETTHTQVYTTLGHPAGQFFPLPDTITGYLLNSCAPRFIPYLAGKVPAIIGSVTIAEMIFSFPGLGSTLLKALIAHNTSSVIVSVFVLLAVNALITFLVKTVLFVMYPRWYEKSI